MYMPVNEALNLASECMSEIISLEEVGYQERTGPVSSVMSRSFPLQVLVITNTGDSTENMIHRSTN